MGLSTSYFSEYAADLVEKEVLMSVPIKFRKHVVSETVKEMKERYPEIYVLFEKQVDEEQVSACLTQVMLERIARAQAKCK